MDKEEKNLDEASRPADNTKNKDKMETIPENPEQKKEPSGDKASRRPNDKSEKIDGDDNAKIGKEGTKTPVDNDGQRDSTLAPEKTGKTVKTVKEEFSEAPEFKLDEELGSLLESEDLSEDFRNKAKTIFESAVNYVIAEQHEKMLDRFESYLQEAEELQEEEIEAKVQRYVDYVVEEWVKDNKLAIETGIRNEINESVVADIVEVLEKHNIELSEEAIDIVEEERAKCERAEKALEESVENVSDVKEQLAETQKLLALVHFSRENSLTMAEEDKLLDLTKETVFESVEDFNEKLSTLKENYFTESSSQDGDALVEDFKGEVVVEQDDLEGTSKVSENDIYLNTLKKFKR